MKTLVAILMQLVCIYFLVSEYNEFNKALPVPVKIIKENPVETEIQKDLSKLKAPEKQIPELTKAVLASHQATGINPKLILALMKTESNFKQDAIGPENRTKIRYKGVLQTPTASWFTDVDTLHGVRILQQKLKETNNDLPKALALYKGGNNKVAHSQAKYVLTLYKQLQE
jgi:soluble lytic murein transglycosylase-like protein